jgi:leucyl/phenylalanyl-tRNA--protein transferase
MPLGRRRLGWFSPDPRAVLPADGMHVSRSLRRSVDRFEITVDARFEDVVRACGDPARPHGWITEGVVEAYVRLHRLGWAHSIEAWQEDRLVGGVYGVSIGSFFAGESMFHRSTDASKVVLVHLCRLMGEVPRPLIDVQWTTPHLASLGVVELPRAEYLDRLGQAVRGPLPPGFVEA